MKVNKREFQRHVGKYLKEGVYTVEVSDKDVTILSDTAQLSDTVKVSDKIIKTKEEAIIATTGKDVLRYGCGCEKEAGKSLCKEHGRY